MWARAAVAAALISAAIGAGTPGLVYGQTREAETPLRLVLLEPIEDAVFARITGQTADLPWQLERAPDAGDGDRFAHAAELAGRTHARAALWITRTASNGIALHLYDPVKERLFEREFAIERADAMAESAALEALALSLRSALRALALDEPVGEKLDPAQEAAARTHGETHATEPAADGAAHAEPTHDDTTDSGAGATDAEDAAREAQLALVVGAGWGAALDGRSPVQHGPFLRAGVGFDRFELGVRAETSLPAEIEQDQTRVRLQRMLALGVLSLRIFGASRFSLALGAGAGAAVFARETLQAALGLMRTGPRHPTAFAIEAEARARLRLFSSASVGVYLDFSAVLLALPAPLQLRFELANQSIDRRLWAFEPQLLLGPTVSFSL